MERIPSPVVSAPAGWRTVRVAPRVEESVSEIPEEELPPFWPVMDPPFVDPVPEIVPPPFPVDDPLSEELFSEEELPVLPLVDCPLERGIPLPIVPGRETV